MKNYRTELEPDKPTFQISHQTRIISIGSCFSENIGKKFSEYKFQININPFGQQYNPSSMMTALNRLLDKKEYTADDLVFHDELYHSFDHHGSFSHSSLSETLKNINKNLECAAEDLLKADVLFLTFGTSHVFSRKDNGNIVSNCHKLSGTHFTKRLLSPDEIVQELDHTLNRLHQANAKLKVILTVSPVRYFAFGQHENTVSKAHLFTALHRLQEMHPEYYYFPAYELVMDDLRDYRFFAEDMLHPNYQATEYVWAKLSDTLLEKNTVKLLHEIDEVLLAARHRPRNPSSDAHKKFVIKNLEKIASLEQKLKVTFPEEIQALSKYL